MLADSGYASEENFARADADGLRLLAPLAKDPGQRRGRPPERARHLDQYPATARASRRLRHPRGRDDYKMRARTVEPVFGQLKTCQKLTMMSRRGLAACESEWLLACAAHNLRNCTGAASRGNDPRANLGQSGLKNAQDRTLAPVSTFQDPPLRAPCTALCDRLVYAWPTLGVNARFCREPGVLCGVRASRWDRVGSSCRASLADWPRDWIGPMVAMSASKESRSITSARGDISAPSRRSRRLTGAHCHPGRPIITIISGMPGRPRSGACGRAAVGGSSGAGRCHAVRAGGGGPAGVRSAARSSSGWQRSRPAMVRASPAARAAAPASCRPVRYQAWSSRPWARW